MRRSDRLAFAAALAAFPPSFEAASAAPRDQVAHRIDGQLVRLSDGRLQRAAVKPGARLYAFYFGASWCGPCRAFLPELKRAYSQLASNGVEIVFVSDDASCSSMRDYIVRERMPWPAIACRKRKHADWLQAARGAALPGLIVYDPNGRKLLSSWRGSDLSRPRDTLRHLKSAISADRAF